VVGLFGAQAPKYEGDEQPTDQSQSGLVGWLFGFLSAPTPKYEGDGQPSSVQSKGLLGGFLNLFPAQPTYAAASDSLDLDLSMPGLESETGK
jgi:hypothetical protein